MREYSKLPQFRSALAPWMIKFLAEKHALGLRYKAGALLLQRVDRLLIEMDCMAPALPRAVVEAWVTRTPGEQVANQRSRTTFIREFARFLRRQAVEAYLLPPGQEPKAAATFIPYIFTAAEVQALLAAVAQFSSHPTSPYRQHVVPVIFHILYGCGMRLAEVLHLRWRDVDLERGILVLRDGKSHVDRLIPMAPTLTQRIQRYAQTAMLPQAPDAVVFPAPDGGPYSCVRIYALFRQALWAAGISHGGRGQGPRVHDLRHTFAVHRLMAWYRAGVDLQAALPVLATYLGHRSLKGTQRYLRLTAELYPDLIVTLDRHYGHVVPGKEH